MVEYPDSEFNARHRFGISVYIRPWLAVGLATMMQRPIVSVSPCFPRLPAHGPLAIATENPDPCARWWTRRQLRRNPPRPGRVRRGAARSSQVSSVSPHRLRIIGVHLTGVCRYHIGESMVPSARQFLKLVDLEETVKNFGFCKKVSPFRLLVVWSHLPCASPVLP